MSLLKPQYFSSDIPMTPTQRRAIHREARKLWWKRPRNAAIWSTVVVGWMVLSNWVVDYVDAHVIRSSSAGRIATEIVMVGIYILAVIFLVNRYDYAPLVRRVMRQYGYDLCLKCGYWLRGLPDDIARCPECGCARRPADTPAAANTPPKRSTS